MVNLWKEFKRNKIKEAMNPVSLDFPEMIDALKEDDELKKTFLESMSKGQKETGKLGLERALMDNIFTEEEWKVWQKKGITISDMGTVFQAYFNQKDGVIPADDDGEATIMVVTTTQSSIFKNRELIFKKLEVYVISPLEHTYMMYLKDKKEFMRIGKKELDLNMKDIDDVISQGRKAFNAPYFKNLLKKLENDKEKYS